MKEVTYGQEYIVIPKFVWLALSKWYPCNKILERKVITRPKNLTKTGTFIQSHGKHNYELEINPNESYTQAETDLKGEHWMKLYQKTEEGVQAVLRAMQARDAAQAILDSSSATESDNQRAEARVPKPYPWD